MQGVDLRMPGGEVVGKLAGAVGGIVVHHQHVHGDGQREELGHHAREIVPFIVGRHDDERLGHAAAGR